MDANLAVQLGDCLDVLPKMPASSADMIYLDPPFFTGRVHNSSTRDGSKSYSFGDVWKGAEEYLEFLSHRLSACKRIMREHGSIFVHGDHNNIHLARQALDLVFGSENFRSEIIWYYKRWSNSRRGLLQQHQTVLHYSYGSNYKWNRIMGEYSATTNVDQILQKRARDQRGKAVYATDEDGRTIFASEKQGVPLGDVWEIPFLNPKAKERTGYPTQKPLLLIERIIKLATDAGDLVVDPFCGSGTTLVAAKLMGRRFVGIDTLPDAISLTRRRLESPVKTESALMRDGMEAYINDDPWVEAHLVGFSFSRVQRNSGLDAVLKEAVEGKAAFVRVQRKDETLSQTIFYLKKSLASKGGALGIAIATGDELFTISDSEIRVLLSPSVQLRASIVTKATPPVRDRIAQRA
jgi:site-specific DNA-methyltransferase (adenine-specific)